MKLRSVHLEGLAPFGTGDVQFPSHGEEMLADLHLFAGINGTGKTRLLSLLAACSGNSQSLDLRMSKPKSSSCTIHADGVKGSFGWAEKGRSVQASSVGFQGLNRSLTNALSENPGRGSSVPMFAQKGSVALKQTPIAAMASVKLGEIPSHASFEEPVEALSKIINQSFANLAMQAAMESMSQNGSGLGRAQTMKQSLESAISGITGEAFSFFVTPDPELHLRVKSGEADMKLQQLPDGLRSVIGTLGSCVAKLNVLLAEHPKPLDAPFFLLLDEPELHLHPSWQWHFLPAAQRLFPNAQIFVATHSPFVLASANHGFIHVLKRSPDSGEVVFEEPRPCSKGDTFLDAAEDVLGVKHWYDPESERLLDEFKTLKASVINGQGSLDALQALAANIASRSESLQNRVGREMAMVRRRLDVAS